MGIGDLEVRSESAAPVSFWRCYGHIRAAMTIACVAAFGIVVVGCDEEPSSGTDASVAGDAAISMEGGGDLLDSGQPVDSGMGEPDMDGSASAQLDGAPAEAGMLPSGRIACYWGPRYMCTGPGEECCESSDVCYVPAEEPEFCP